MLDTIAKYQKAFGSMIDRLKKNDSVLAVMVFGSIVSGDLWEGSDIDLFVISKDKSRDIIDVYSEENGIPVHIKLLGKESLLKLQKEELPGGFIHRVFASSRLVFSKDQEITAQYDIGRYYSDLDREKWNIVFLGELLKSISVCKKYLYNNNMDIAYYYAIRCVEDFAKLYINSSGYMISKDVITMAMNLNDKFKFLTDDLLFAPKEKKQETIDNFLFFLDDDIENNLKKYVKLLISYMKSKDCFLSSENLRKSDFFKGFKINFESILNKLWEKGIVKKESREYKDQYNNLLFKERVYFV